MDKLLEKTKSGLDAVWESGGNNGRSGNAVIVCDKNGERKVPCFINKQIIPNNKVCLFTLDKGDYIISMVHNDKSYEKTIYRYEGDSTLVPVNENENLIHALHFAKLKCQSYKCKSIFYYKKLK